VRTTTDRQWKDPDPGPCSPSWWPSRWRCTWSSTPWCTAVRSVPSSWMSPCWAPGAWARPLRPRGSRRPRRRASGGLGAHRAQGRAAEEPPGSPGDDGGRDHHPAEGLAHRARWSPVGTPGEPW